MTTILLGVGLAFLLVVALIVVWARRLSRSRQPRPLDDRERFIRLATFAASDPGGPAFLQLLAALEAAGPGCPVSVAWVKRAGRDGAPDDVLVKIAWDGNEWRRALAIAPFVGQLRGHLSAQPALSSGLSERMLVELEP